MGAQTGGGSDFGDLRGLDFWPPVYGNPIEVLITQPVHFPRSPRVPGGVLKRSCVLSWVKALGLQPAPTLSRTGGQDESETIASSSIFEEYIAAILQDRLG